MNIIEAILSIFGLDEESQGADAKWAETEDNGKIREEVEAIEAVEALLTKPKEDEEE